MTFADPYITAAFVGMGVGLAALILMWLAYSTAIITWWAARWAWSQIARRYARSLRRADAWWAAQGYPIAPATTTTDTKENSR